MFKSVMKEIVLILLLLVAILLLLGVFLYDYIPTNKVVPKIEQYEVPNSIKQELEESINELEEEQTQIVYEIDGTDLKNYEKSKDYQKGKVNPFAEYSADAEETDNNSTTTNNNTNSGSNYILILAPFFCFFYLEGVLYSILQASGNAKKAMKIYLFKNNLQNLHKMS